MAQDFVPASSASDGRWKITYIPTSSDALSVVDLTATDAVDVTYSFTPDGFARAVSQATVNDPRLTLTQDLSRPGKKTETLETKYVESKDEGSVNVLLTEGTTGKFVVRRGYDNDVEYAAGQTVDVITFIAGAQRPDAPAENGIDTISQTQFITAPTISQGVLVA